MGIIVSFISGFCFAVAMTILTGSAVIGAVTGAIMVIALRVTGDIRNDTH